MTDATYTLHPSPVGDVFLASTADGLLAMHVLTDDDHELQTHLTRLTIALHALPEPDDAAYDEVRRQLDEYFAGTRRAFDLRLDWRLAHGFSLEALHAVQHVPYAQTAGYGEVAAMAGRPRAHRAVGNACARTPFSIVVPVHRVVHADGSIGGYGGSVGVKRFLLDHERAVGE